MISKKGIIASLILALSLFSIWSQQAASPYSIKFLPGGSFLFTNNAVVWVKTGAGGALNFAYQTDLWDLYLDGTVAYDNIAFDDDITASILSAGIGLGIKYPLSDILHLYAGVQGGYFLSYMAHTDPANNDNGNNPAVNINTGLEYQLSSRFGLGLDISYRYLHAFFPTLQAALNLHYHLPRKKEKIKSPEQLRLELLKQELEPIKKGNGLGLAGLKLFNVFPVFYKYYDENPIGLAILHNWERKTAEDIKVSFFIKNLMDYPKEVTAPASLKPGGEAVIDLHSLLSSKILGLSESTKVSANIKISYQVKGEQKTEEIIETLRIYDRNAITWDNDEKAAAFVTAKESSVLKFSKNVASLIQGQQIKIIERNLLYAIGIFEALSFYGMTYVVDPTTPYKEFSANAQSVDYLQFPIQTLEYRAGDCDDLSILFCSLLEAVGIDTAFITIPGHIFTAFSLKMTQEQAMKTFHNTDDFIFLDGNSWIPVEITMIEQGFLSAWRTGAKQWREYNAENKTGFYPIKQAWKTYEPVGFSLSAEVIILPEKDNIIDAFFKQVEEFIDREIHPRKERLLAQLKEKESAKIRNRLGVLYAKYGRLEAAGLEFKKIIKKEAYAPALINLGNIAFLDNKMEEALGFYTRADKVKPDNPKILLALARTNYALGNYEATEVAFNKVKAADAGLAEDYAYLELKGEEGFRAADITLKGEILWNEE
jgi:tetratricopeptide (TPR) repeat protein